MRYTLSYLENYRKDRWLRLTTTHFCVCEWNMELANQKHIFKNTREIHSQNGEDHFSFSLVFSVLLIVILSHLFQGTDLFILKYRVRNTISLCFKPQLMGSSLQRSCRAINAILLEHREVSLCIGKVSLCLFFQIEHWGETKRMT